MLTLKEIYSWAKTDSTKRNYREGKRVLAARFIISCGKNKINVDSFTVSARCIGTSKLKGSPHKVERTNKK